jgi:hypothetical protein
MMKPKSLAVILAMMVLAGIAAAQAVASGAAPPAVRILAPKPDEKLSQSAVTVQFQLDNPGMAGGSPNFSVQLDNRDPIVTPQTSQDSTGLTPGPHIVVVQLVDANNTPIAGTRAETQFTVSTPAAQPQPARPPDQARTDLPQGDAAISDQGEILPSASSALPLLSVIGFGALLGGVLSAMRTR